MFLREAVVHFIADFMNTLNKEGRREMLAIHISKFKKQYNSSTLKQASITIFNFQICRKCCVHSILKHYIKAKRLYTVYQIQYG